MDETLHYERFHQERFHHIGLVVADLERSLGFYRDRIGLALLASGAESDERYAEMLGVPRVSFAWAELDLGGGHVLELLRFDQPSEAPSDDALDGTPGAAPAAQQAGQPGALSHTAPGALSHTAHLGIRVGDIDAVHDALVKDGVTVFSRPVELVEENHWLGTRVFYALDPDRHMVELIQSAVDNQPASG